jgi:hypothetical protein
MKWLGLAVGTLIVCGAVLALPLLFATLSTTFGSAAQLRELLRLQLMSAAFVTALWALYVKDNRLRAHSENVLVSLVIFVIALLVGLVASLIGAFDYPEWLPAASRVVGLLSLEVYVIATAVLLVYVFTHTYNAVYNLRKDKFLKYFRPFRYLRARFGPHKPYEITMRPRTLPDTLPQLLQVCTSTTEDRERLKGGAAILVKGKISTAILRDVLRALVDQLKSNTTLNLVVAGDHPHRYWMLMNDLGADAHAKDIVFVDAYTPVFGFTDDDINNEQCRKITECGVSVVKARSFAGIHSGVAQAFNIIKARENKEDRNRRRPSAIVYANTSALCDIESTEQFRIFWRHVIPSERAYGMLCIIIEHDGAGREVFDILEQLVDYTVCASIDANGTVTFTRS